MLKWMMVAALAVLTTGCAGTRMGRHMGINSEADVGPAPVDYKPSLEAAIKAGLKDPYSAHIDIGDAEKASCGVGIYGPHWGWRVPVTVNAKNSWGAYTGAQTTYYWLNSQGMVEKMWPDPTQCP